MASSPRTNDSRPAGPSQNLSLLTKAVFRRVTGQTPTEFVEYPPERWRLQTNPLSAGRVIALRLDSHLREAAIIGPCKTTGKIDFRSDSSQNSLA